MVQVKETVCKAQNMRSTPKFRTITISYITGSVALALIFAGLGAAAQQEKTDFDSLLQLTPKLIRLQNQFERTMPPGVTIEAREVSRSGSSGKDLRVLYNIYLTGAPSDSLFRQIQWPVDKERSIPGFQGISLNSNGEMICSGRSPGQCHSSIQSDAPINFAMDKPLKGEPRRFAFTSKETKVAISIVPDPIEGADRGCKISVIRLSAKFELALIEGSGFPPNSDVRVLTSGDVPGGIVATGNNRGNITTSDAVLFTGDGNIAETYPLLLKTDSNGFVESAILKKNVLRGAGKENVRVTGQGCEPKATYEFGAF